MQFDFITWNEHFWHGWHLMQIWQIRIQEGSICSRVGYTRTSGSNSCAQKTKFLPVSTALKETSKTNKKIAGWGGLNWKQNKNKYHC